MKGEKRVAGYTALRAGPGCVRRGAAGAEGTRPRAAEEEGGRGGVEPAAARRGPVGRAERRARSPSSGSAGRGRGAQWGRSGGGGGGAGAPGEEERWKPGREGDGRGPKVGKEGRGGRAGVLAQGPRAPEPGEVQLGGGARGAEGGGEAVGAGSVFGAPRQGGWRPPVRAGRCVCALCRSGRKMVQKGKLG